MLWGEYEPETNLEHDHAVSVENKDDLGYQPEPNLKPDHAVSGEDTNTFGSEPGLNLKHDNPESGKDNNTFGSELERDNGLQYRIQQRLGLWDGRGLW